MPLSEYARHLLAIAQTFYRWAGQISALDTARRDKVALYAEEIAATLARAAQAFIDIDHQPTEKKHLLSAHRELGRIAGYLDTIVAALAHHLDGRKLAGVKRRLEHLVDETNMVPSLRQADAVRIGRLVEAEGYFRALADGLRA